MFNRILIKVTGFIAILMLGIGLNSDLGMAQTNPNSSANQPPIAVLSQPQLQPVRQPTPLPFWFEKAEEIWRDYLSKAETASSDDQRRQNSDLEAQWAMAYAAIAMALFTFMQLFVTGVTLLYLKWTFAENRKAANASIAAADSALRSAEAAETEAKDTRQNFENTERPYVYIFGPTKFFGTVDDGYLSLPWAEYCVANFGRTPAKCEKIMCEMVKLQADEPSEPTEAPPDNAIVINPVLAPSERRDATRIEIPDNLELKGMEFPTLLLGENIFLQIWVIYRGPFGGKYETRVSWKWDNNKDQFVYFRLNNSKYNRMT